MYKINPEKAKRQLQALIVGLRPSILWRIDGVTRPLDLLDDDGIAGWQVGLEILLPQIQDLRSPGASEILAWVSKDRQREETRWRNPDVVLAHARLILGDLKFSNKHDPDLVMRWRANIDAALERSPGNKEGPTPFTCRQSQHLLRLLGPDGDSSSTSRDLARLGRAAPSPGSPRSRVLPILLTTRAESLALASWLPHSFEASTRPLHMASA